VKQAQFLDTVMNDNKLKERFVDFLNSAAPGNDENLLCIGT